MNDLRIDKWMWATRIFKTRTIAVEACKKSRISVNGAVVKPSRMIKVGDVIDVRKPPVQYSFRVLDLTANRVGASLVPKYLENITPPEQLQLLELQKINGFIDRARGTGRPTKKDRRNLDDFATPTFIDDDFDFEFDF
jgi:ribosome-associated heat shock protein Hsp15